MNIISSCALTAGDEKEIRGLEKLCKLRDGLHNDVYLNNALNFDSELPCYFRAFSDGTLVGFIAVFAPTKMEAEITAFTHPDFRRKKIFKTLFTEVKKTMLSYGIARFLLVVEAASNTGNQVIKHFENAKLFTSELTLECKSSSAAYLPKNCKIVEVTPQNKSLAAKLLGSSFGDISGSEAFINTGLEAEDREVYMAYDGELPVGVVNLYYKDDTAMIYGLTVGETYRKKGYGRALLTYAREKGLENKSVVTLDVDINNKTAINLYLSNGFEKASQTFYYIFTGE